MNLLFICSKNQWRSPTAEKIYSKSSAYQVRSAGTSRSARKQVKESDLQWADAILVMEYKHKQRLKADYPALLKHKKLAVLDIPDDYAYMDAELIELIKTAVEGVIENDY